MCIRDSLKLLDFVLVALVTFHQIEQELPVDGAFGVSVSCHVSGVAPLQRADES